ncbi:hypothetical protein BGX38DRAFT_379329 [Terfezia claveryi]|nr:hypothetical protein BGX38DRAFT_379329 [Terfezia claveryi]
MGWSSAGSCYSGPDTSENETEDTSNNHTRYRSKRTRELDTWDNDTPCQLPKRRKENSQEQVSLEHEYDSILEVEVPVIEVPVIEVPVIEVPVIEVPYWKVSKDYGGMTLHNWEFGVGDIQEWPFDEADYNRWKLCRPLGYMESSIWHLHPCKDFDQLTRQNLCADDQVLDVFDFLTTDTYDIYREDPRIYSRHQVNLDKYLLSENG